MPNLQQSILFIEPKRVSSYDLIKYNTIVTDGNETFLKTIIPSRKAKIYKG